MPFSTFGLHPSLLEGIRDLGYQKPTPIQQDAIPPAMEGRDVLACAMTGSGKTAAFLLPILHRLLGQERGVTRVLVLSPTRELAAQIEQNFRELAAHTPLKSAAIYGGVAMGPQQRAFESGVDLLVATPGRLLDHFQYPYAQLSNLEVLVLDEADRMLDMGFLPDIRRVLKHLPAGSRHTLFFSATMPPPIAALAREMLKNPATVNLERQSAPATGITHTIFPVREDLKTALLLELLRRNEIQSALVFTRTKHRANRVAEYLVKHGVPCDRIHGNRSQPQRTLALTRFKEGKDRVLVATDIAARGIDVEGLTHVINLDVPGLPEDYIHRVGRTARAEAVGDAFTFLGDQEANEMNAIERTIGRRLPRRIVEGFDYSTRPSEKLEIPIAERIAAIRARKAEERARAKEKARLKAEREAQQAEATAKKQAEKAARPQPGSGNGRPRQAGAQSPGPRQQAGGGRPGQPASGGGRPQGRNGKGGGRGRRPDQGAPSSRGGNEQAPWWAGPSGASNPPSNGHGHGQASRRHEGPRSGRGSRGQGGPIVRTGPDGEVDGNIAPRQGHRGNENWEPKDPAAFLPERRPNGVAGRAPVSRQELYRRSGRGNGPR